MIRFGITSATIPSTIMTKTNAETSRLRRMSFTNQSSDGVIEVIPCRFGQLLSRLR